jgi:hypothetical protein
VNTVIPEVGSSTDNMTALTSEQLTSVMFFSPMSIQLPTMDEIKANEGKNFA